MLANYSIFGRLFGFNILVLVAALSIVHAQEGTVEEIQYREDYDRIQEILKVNNLVKRADQIVKLYEERSDLNPQLRDYTDGLLANDLESLLKQGNYIAVRGLSESALKVRPKFGSMYLYYGVALKNDKRIEEALLAFAKGSLIKSPYQARAKQQFDVTYRSTTGGSLIGQDKIIAKAKAELE
jgi:tetratricopeptide (TPR) repeat protein